jgi:hypothetical protein
MADAQKVMAKSLEIVPLTADERAQFDALANANVQVTLTSGEMNLLFTVLYKQIEINLSTAKALGSAAANRRKEALDIVTDTLGTSAEEIRALNNLFRSILDRSK